MRRYLKEQYFREGNSGLSEERKRDG